MRMLPRKFVFLALLIFLWPTVFQAKTTKTGEKCGVDMTHPPQRILADVDGKGAWKEYKDVAAIPDINLSGGAAAFVWSGSKDKILVELQEPTEDWDSYTFYCFDQSKLWQLGYELRTAWGWGFREEGPIVQGKLVAENSEFFNTSNDQATSRPEMADDVPDALRPTLYLSRSRLPFFKLMQDTEHRSGKTKG